MMENTSGQRIDAEIPEGIDEWNWGAFFLNWIWGIGNKTYIAFLALIPLINIVMMIILGLKGNKMAWKNKEWESVEHFKEVQKKWNLTGIVAFGIYIIIFIINFWDAIQ